MDKLTQEIAPILVLCAVIAVVVVRLPKVDLGHSEAFRFRRTLNWVPLGLTYAFLYMARYNMTVLKNEGGILQRDFGNIDFWGSLVYGVSFLVNGPLCDRIGGRKTILIAAGGALAANALIGVLWLTGTIDRGSSVALSLLFVVNMYFQSFGAVSIVKVNASWFHLRERGTFGGIFGTLISLGLYFALDWGTRIAALGCPSCDAHVHNAALPAATPAESLGLAWLFLIPAAILAVFWALSFALVRDTPAAAGLADFDVEDASSGQGETREPAARVIARMLRNPVILTIAIIELCSGFLRQGLLKWSSDFASGTGVSTYVNRHWGMVSCVAGITGGMFAGVISDHLFRSRRPPVSSVLYLIMLAGAIAMIPLLGSPAVSWIIAVMAMAIIGVHGMLSGVASQDFGGRLNTGVAVGLIDGFVYLGTAIQDQVYGGYGSLLPEKGTAAAKLVSEWSAWPIAMVPVAAVGLALSLRIWNARVVRRPALPVAVAVARR